MPPPAKEGEDKLQSGWGRLLRGGGPWPGRRCLTGLQRPSCVSACHSEVTGLWDGDKRCLVGHPQNLKAPDQGMCGLGEPLEIPKLGGGAGPSLGRATCSGRGIPMGNRRVVWQSNPKGKSVRKSSCWHILLIHLQSDGVN